MSPNSVWPVLASLRMGKKFQLSLRKMRRFASLQSWYAKERTRAFAAAPLFFVIYQKARLLAYLLLYCLAILHPLSTI
jgi:hypothetical protein